MPNLTYQFASQSQRGTARTENQDGWFAHPEFGLYGVSDGMGGQSSGGLASRIVVESLPGLLKQRLARIGDLRSLLVQTEIANAIKELSNAVRAESVRRPELRGMGATVAMVFLQSEWMIAGHLGDSRIYLFRDGNLQQLTVDHNLARALIAAGEIPTEQPPDNVSASKLTCYVGMNDAPQPDIVSPLQLTLADRILISTDGLTGKLSPPDLSTILQQPSDPIETCRRLIDAAVAAGSEDDVTALIIDVT